MAKTSGGTRALYPGKGQSVTTASTTASGNKPVSLSYMAAKDSPMGKVGKEAFARLSDDVTKILSDANISTSGVSVNVLDSSLYIQSKDIQITREFSENTGVMEHAYFEITDPNARGKGVSKAIHRALMPIYEKLGVKRLDVYAALDNGGYTWAQYGFRITRFSVPHLIDYQMHEKYQPQARALVKDYFEAHPDAKFFPMRIMSSQPWGKEALTGTSWYGYLDFTDSEQKKDFTDYIGYKK